MIFLPSKKKFLLTAVLSAFFSFAFSATLVYAGNIDATYNKARFLDDNTQINFGLSAGDVTVTSSAVTGHAWSETAGWINFTPSASGQAVINNGSGVLSGYGWGEGTGWVNFKCTANCDSNGNFGVTIDSSGYFHGYAWSEKKGWIVFNCDTDSSCGSLDHKVKTDWALGTGTCTDGIQNGNETGIDTGGRCGGGGGGGGSGSITVCKMIIDTNDVVATSPLNLPPAFFSVSLATSSVFGSTTIQTTSFNSATFSPNQKIISVSENDAECTTYSLLPFGGYFYNRESVNASTTVWHTPLYNDQFATQVGNLSNFYIYGTPGNNDANGEITIDQSQTSRTLVILNTYDASTVFPPTDVCPNILGDQPTMPFGYMYDTFGNCVPIPPDVDYCPNIDGIQTSVPSGMTVDQNGDCVPLPINNDVCPNIAGIQTSVPIGMTINQDGDCVPIDTPVVPPPSGTTTSTTTPWFPPIPNIFVELIDIFGKLPSPKEAVVVSQIVSLAGLALSIFAIPWAALINSILIFFALRKKERPWGTVYDSETKQPLDPAYVTLSDSPSGEEVASAITDLDGRYGFLTKRGIYKMFSKKTNYLFPSKKLSGKKADELYSDLYFGEDINITDPDAVITKNIPMDSLTFDWNEFAKRDKKLLTYYSKWDKFLSRVSEILFTVGIATSLYAFIVAPNVINAGILGLYGVLLVVRFAGFKPRTYGTVVNRENGVPLSFAIIRIISANFPLEIAHAVADIYGKYYCLVPNGFYKIVIDRKDFSTNYTRVFVSDVVKVRKGIVRDHFKV